MAMDSNDTGIAELPCDDPTIVPLAACVQSDTGTRYRLWMTLSCPVVSTDSTATSSGSAYVSGTVYVPLTNDDDDAPVVVDVTTGPGNVSSESGNAGANSTEA